MYWFSGLQRNYNIKTAISSEVKSRKIEMAVTKDLTSSSKFSGSCGLTFQTALQRSRMRERKVDLRCCPLKIDRREDRRSLIR
jgi:hypothetical protein